jgi:ParB/RepB/Spo0J family partition protein
VGAVSKTKKLDRKDIPVHLLEKNEHNPNKMSKREFDLLVDNIETTGLTDPVLVRPIQGTDRYRIVGGHHRCEAALFLGFEEVPCTILPDDFDEKQEQFQLVRMNMIRGKLDPNAFFNLYSKLSNEYSDEILQEAFGFSEEAEFRKLVQQTAKTIADPEMKKKFTEAAAEIKTVDGLSKLLNEIFTKYGDTLPYGFMVFDHAGQRSMWLRIEGKTMKALDVIADICIDRRRTVDDVIGEVLRLVASGESKEFIDGIIAATPEMDLPVGLQVAPTKEHIDNVKALENA